MNRPGVPGLLEAIEVNQFSSHNVNAVLVRVAPGFESHAVADTIRRWKYLQAYTGDEMEEILVGTLIATSARQIFVFLLILSLVSTTIVAFIIYTMTMAKIKEIAVLKLIGARNTTIAGMILQEALGLGAVGYALKPVKREELEDAFKRLEFKFAQRMKHVLVVEDDDRQRESVRQLLAGEDVEIVGVKAAAEALEKKRPGVFWAAHQCDLEYSQIERLTNLKALPPSGFKVACFPLKIQGGSAAPARVVAIVP